MPSCPTPVHGASSRMAGSISFVAKFSANPEAICIEFGSRRARRAIWAAAELDWIPRHLQTAGTDDHIPRPSLLVIDGLCHVLNKATRYAHCREQVDPVGSRVCPQRRFQGHFQLTPVIHSIPVG